MQDRKPFKLRGIIIVYNFLQVLFSLYLFLEVSAVGWLAGGYNWRCQPVNHSTDEKTMRMVAVCWWYYFSKFTEFFDTFFFVLRKRYDQVSTLHVIHHGIMPFSVWWGVKFMPGGHSTFFGFLNTFVHIIMYSYYMLAAMGPEMQKYLWWKKYLTMFQMAQFVGIFTHAFQLFFSNACNYPIVFAYWIGGHGVLFLFLFSNFYKQAYKKKDVKVKVDRDINENALNGGNGLYVAKEKTAIDQNGNHAIANGTRSRVAVSE
jgi:elongation of very long chain fatty acids protein 7